MANLLSIEGISKKYKDKEVLHSIDFEFHEGIYGLLGPNGAGKTTLINIIAGALLMTEGHVQWNGKDVQVNKVEYRSGIGFLPQHLDFYNSFSATEFLEYMAYLKDADVKEIDEILEIVNLNAVRDKKIASFSGGMKQRLGIAQALLGNPRLLLLDEPTVGLDLEERARFKSYLKSIAHKTIIILSTHIVSDIEEISDHVLFIKEGMIKKVIDNQHLNDLEEIYLSLQE